jgi:hypothetical protein
MNTINALITFALVTVPIILVGGIAAGWADTIWHG